MATEAGSVLPRGARAYVDRTRALFAKVDGLPADDLSTRSHWARYLVVLTSGLMEVGIEEIFADYASTKSAPNVARYVERQLGRIQNPNMARIRELVGSFSVEWAESLSADTAGEVADAVDSVMANRNQIVHGGNVGVTVVRSREYFERCVELLEYMAVLVA